MCESYVYGRLVVLSLELLQWIFKGESGFVVSFLLVRDLTLATVLCWEYCEILCIEPVLGPDGSSLVVVLINC